MTKIESGLIALSSGIGVYLIDKHFADRPPQTSIGRMVLPIVLAIIIAFVFNLVRSPWLSDPARSLSGRKERKISEHLAQFNRGGIVRIHALATNDRRAAKGIDELCHSLQSAINSSGPYWRADLCGTERRDHQAKRYSDGIWLCGGGLFEGSPAAADILQDALRGIGERVRVDRLQPSSGINIIVGLREDKCFLPFDLSRRKRIEQKAVA